MDRKVIMVVVDALRDDTARDQMGYMQHLVEARLATRYTSIGELPTMSRPMYETLHTGVTVSEHGITSNRIVRRSQMPNVFALACAAGRTTAAAAHAWMSELYNHAPYDPIRDVHVDDPELLIQHGRFYLHDATPDSEVFAWGPEYLLAIKHSAAFAFALALFCELLVASVATRGAPNGAQTGNEPRQQTKEHD